MTPVTSPERVSLPSRPSKRETTPRPHSETRPPAFASAVSAKEEPVSRSLDVTARDRNPAPLPSSSLSDPEWESIERAANRKGIPAAEYVRTAAVDAAEGRTAALDAEMIETIRLIYRMTYVLAII